MGKQPPSSLSSAELNFTYLAYKNSIEISRNTIQVKINIQIQLLADAEWSPELRLTKRLSPHHPTDGTCLSPALPKSTLKQLIVHHQPEQDVPSATTSTTTITIRRSN